MRRKVDEQPDFRQILGGSGAGTFVWERVIVTRFVGLVFAPALALISPDPTAAKTVRPEVFGIVATKDQTSSRQGDGQHPISLWGDLLQDSQQMPPVPPLPGKQLKLRHGFVLASGEPDSGLQKGEIVGDLLRGGAHHRKAVWPDLNFVGHGQRRGGSVRPGGAGGWDDGPYDPIDPVTPTGQDPEEHPGGPTDGGDPFTPQQPVNGGDQPDPISPVPLPAAGWLLMAALGGVAAMGRRRSRA